MDREADHPSATTVTAVFTNPDRARAALDHAERLGVDGSRLHAMRLGNPDPALDLDRDPLDREHGGTDEHIRVVHEGARRDARLTRFVGERLLTGAIAGAFIGAVVAVIVIFVADVIETSAVAVIVAAALGAMAASIIGAIVGGILAAPTTPSWERTLAAEGDEALLVSAHPADGETLERLVRAWKEHEPAELRTEGDARAPGQ